MKRKTSYIVQVALLGISILLIISLIYVKDYTGEHDYDYSNDGIHIGHIVWGLNVKHKCHFGHHDWYAYDITNADLDEETIHNGCLIGKYEYYDDKEDSRYYGEGVGLWVYDISDQIKSSSSYPYSLKNDSIKYVEIASKYCPNDSSRFYFSDKFAPHVSVETTTSLNVTIKNGPHYKFSKTVLIFENDRVYHFLLIADCDNLENLSEAFVKYDKRFSYIVSKIDFDTYRDSKADYYDNLNRKYHSGQLYQYLYICIWTLFFIMLIVAAIGPKRNNRVAFRLWLYILICAVLSYIYSLYIVSHELLPDIKSYYRTYEIWTTLLCAFAVSMYCVLLSSTKYLSHYDYNTNFLIPNSVDRIICRSNDVIRRLIKLIYFIPLYYIVPIPLIGWIMFVLYVLPISIILLVWAAISWVVGTPTENREVSSVTEIQYCRMCGNKIESKANYCKHCGFKL